jgi:hypothetical protein
MENKNAINESEKIRTESGSQNALIELQSFPYAINIFISTIN